MVVLSNYFYIHEGRERIILGSASADTSAQVRLEYSAIMLNLEEELLLELGVLLIILVDVVIDNTVVRVGLVDVLQGLAGHHPCEGNQSLRNLWHYVVNVHVVSGRCHVHLINLVVSRQIFHFDVDNLSIESEEIVNLQGFSGDVREVVEGFESFIVRSGGLHLMELIPLLEPVEVKEAYAVLSQLNQSHIRLYFLLDYPCLVPLRSPA